MVSLYPVSYSLIRAIHQGAGGNRCTLVIKHGEVLVAGETLDIVTLDIVTLDIIAWNTAWDAGDV